jgi:anhydro-N-acetylmuramic acid kinase
MRVIGLMSGTSVDGVDAAVVEIHGAPPDLAITLLSFSHLPFDANQQGRIFGLFEPTTGTVDHICHMNFAIGEWFAAAALQAVADAGLSRPDAASGDDIALIGSHGQTIYHSVGADAPVKSTLQIGEAAVIAARTGVTTVADFRVADVAAGGQGAPLVSYVDWLLLRHPTLTRAVQNIGGIANVTYLPPGDDPAGVIAFDTGPGNMLIDDAVRRATNGTQTYDRNGTLAAQGRIDRELLAELMAHSYLAQAPPKTTGREQFGVPYGAKVWALAQRQGLCANDIVATLTAFTAVSIADAYRRFLPHMPDEVILGGGGASNPILVHMLQQHLAPARVTSHETVGLPSDAKEAVAFAVLAYEALYGRPGNLPTCTGAGTRTILGKITPGANYTSLLSSVGLPHPR